jgi:hypothetical protein
MDGQFKVKAAHVEYFGFQELFKLTHGKYRLHLRGKNYYDERWLEFGDVMDRLEEFTQDISDFLDEVRCREADQLRAYLRRRHAHPCNPFAGPWEASPIQKRFTRLGGDSNPWRCHGEDSFMRQQCIQWAVNG